MSDLNVGQLTTHTLRLRRKKLVDSVSDHRPFTHAMKKHGGIKRVSGGRTVFVPFMYQQNPTVGWIGEGEEISLQQRPIIDGAEFPWYHAGGSLVITGPEKRMNSGESAVLDIVKAKATVLEESMKNIYHSGVLSNGTGSGGKQVTGALAHISKTPATGTLGGIPLSGTDAAFFRNFDFDTSADWSDGSVDAGNVKRFLSKLINNTVHGATEKFGYMGDTHYEFLEQALQAHQQVMKGDDNVGATHDYLTYRGIKWYFGGGVNFSGESQVQDDLTYLICPGEGKFQIVFHKDAEFEVLEPVNARNQDAISRLMILMMTVVTGMRKVQAVGYDS